MGGNWTTGESPGQLFPSTLEIERRVANDLAWSKADCERANLEDNVAGDGK